VASFVVACLAAGAMTLALGKQMAGGILADAAPSPALLGAATNAIVVWTEHFACALVGSRGRRRPGSADPGGPGHAWRRAGQRPSLAAAGARLVGAVVLMHAVPLTARIGRPWPLERGHHLVSWAGSAALLAGLGLGVLLVGRRGRLRRHLPGDADHAEPPASLEPWW
jgi:nitrite reductase (NO-forming)